ncbi:unnamed protein product [Pseudo-nitzschia multistriata]|uniref:Uncharacterized protein n=1 Tax=Pseudo-nitzschia multistriata TaxID=183589 RepID=A0A448ZKN7_9STRA|nr:unnamed protein product [Pseudo-nitzschia multistriata]
MKHTFLSAVGLGLTFIITRVVDGLSGSELYEYYRLQTPLVSLIEENNNTIIMDYGMSESFVSDNIRAEIFTEDCEYPVLVDGIISQAIDDQGKHLFQIDPRTLSNNTKVFSLLDDPYKAKMKFCLRHTFFSGPESDNGSIPINYLESILTVFFDLRAAVYVGFSVEQKELDFGSDRNNVTEKEGYEADGYICHPETYERMETPKEGYGPGSVVCICAELNQEAIDEGLYLVGLTEFVWIRERYLGDELIRTVQYSVKDGVAAVGGLTEYECITDYFCMFKTFLLADFYILPGVISGYGSVAFAFGSRSDNEVGRRVLETHGLRSLQQEAEDPNSDLFVALPVTNRRPELKSVETAAATNISYKRSTLWFIACSATGALLSF